MSPDFPTAPGLGHSSPLLPQASLPDSVAYSLPDSPLLFLTLACSCPRGSSNFHTHFCSQDSHSPTMFSGTQT